MYALVNINKSETKDLISDKSAIRKDTTVIRTYDYELPERTVSIKCSYLYPGFISNKIIISVSFLIAGLSEIRS